MPTVKALSNINHDGVDYHEGELLDVSEAQASALFEAGAAEVNKSSKRADSAQEAEVVDSKKK